MRTAPTAATEEATRNTAQERNLQAKRREPAEAEELQDARSGWIAPTPTIRTRIGRRPPKGSVDHPPKKDPKNKQFAVCDEQLQKVFGVKRFRTFGMMKYLKSHFTD